MEKKEIKKGDFVRMKHYPFEGQICQITGIPKEGMYLTDRCSLCTDAHFEPIDPKTAFLNDLSELLRKHEANICWAIGMNFTECAAIMKVHTPYFNLQYSGADGVTLTPDNVLNYDK